MKKINILCLLSLLICIGCDSILDKDPKDTFTDENFWTNEAKVQAYANTFFQRFTGYGNGNATGDFYFKTLSDDQAGNSFTDWTHIQVPSSESNWKEGWIEIRRANIMLEKVPGVDAMSEEAKNHWLGVAHLMRAWEYYKLVRMFGDVPWIDKSLAIADEGYIYAARENRDKIMEKVLEDLEFACINIRDNKSKITFSRDLAYAMKAETCLYEGTFRKYRKTEDKQGAQDLDGAKAFLTEAKAAAATIMGKSYMLNASYQGNYNSVDLSKNPEMIFYKAYKENILMHSLIAYITSSTQISGMTKAAFESYLFTDGKPGALTILDNTDLPKVQITGKDTIYTIKHLLQVRDKRLSETIDDLVFHTNRNYTRTSGGIAMSTSTGYGVKKYDNPEIPLGYMNQTSKNYTHAPLFWLAVIYLQYAEACAELATVGGDPILQSDLDKSINLLKERAGLPPLDVTVGFSDPANNHGVSDLLWEIRRERRCELMFDNWARYWDLIRWHQLDKLDSTVYPDILLGANLKDDPDLDNDKIKVANGYMDGSKDKKRTYDPKYYLYPIPSGQIILNSEITNNPGWE